MKKATKKRKQGPPACGCRLHLTGHEIEGVLRRHHSMPARQSDQTVVGDLACLEWQLIVVRDAVATFLGHKVTAPRLSFESRLAYLVAAVDGMKRICLDLEKPLGRILKRKAGVSGELLATTRALANLTEGFTKRAVRERAD